MTLDIYKRLFKFAMTLLPADIVTLIYTQKLPKGSLSYYFGPPGSSRLTTIKMPENVNFNSYTQDEKYCTLLRQAARILQGLLSNLTANEFDIFLQSVCSSRLESKNIELSSMPPILLIMYLERLNSADSNNNPMPEKEIKKILSAIDIYHAYKIACITFSKKYEAQPKPRIEI